MKAATIASSSSSAASMAADQNRRPRATGPEASLFRVSRFIVKSDQGDYLVCRRWNGASEGTIDVKVAKPPVLRRTPWEDGVDIIYSNGSHRTVNGEAQEISPPYENDESEIYAVMVPGGTGVNGGSNARVNWLDLNVDARAWTTDDCA